MQRVPNKKIKIEDKIKNNDLVAVLNQNQELICLGLAKATSNEILKRPKGLAVKTTKVFKTTKEE